MRRSTLAIALVAAFISYLGTPATVKAGGYDEVDLVVNKSPLTDKNGHVHKGQVDSHLLNPWGIAESSGSPFWVSDNNAGVATLYNVPASGKLTVNPLVVSIPSPGDPTGNGGAPTGAVFNIDGGATGGFKISGVNRDGKDVTASAVFLFATEDGTIVGWNPGVGSSRSSFNGPNGVSTQGIIAVDNSGNNFTVPTGATGAVYKGLAISKDASGMTRLYATNFRSGVVEMYKDDFHALTSPPAFVDPQHLPDSYAPFNVAVLNGAVFVTFAKQDAAKHDPVAGEGHGFVDVFELDGTFRQRFAQHGQLNSPWGVAQAPIGFGALGGALWIGNFGNGHINAFNLDSGEFLDKVRDSNGQAIVIDGLWALQVGNGGNGGLANTLYFTAGPNGETDGLFGSLNPH